MKELSLEYRRLIGISRYLVVVSILISRIACSSSQTGGMIPSLTGRLVEWLAGWPGCIENR